MSKKMGDFKSAMDGSGLDKFFNDPSIDSILETEPEEEPKKEEPKTEPKKKKTETHKVFSFRAPIETADNWRLWADAKGMKVDELGTKAITEYIKKHPLTADQNQIYELKKAQKKS